MLASLKWLRHMCRFELGVDELARRLSEAGLEVEAVHHKGVDLDGVVVAEVRAKRAHETRDKLSLVTVFDGEREQEVVCGAPNVPEPGGRVLFARLGATLPNGLQIAERKIGGVVSRGMICSEAELDIGAGEDGIFVFGDEPGTPGDSAKSALDLEDTVLDIGLTPNRPDCLGHLGVAREIALLCDGQMEAPSIATPAQTFGGALPVSVDIQDADRCPRYSAAMVRGVKIGPSPFWLRYRLHNLGVRSISNVVDATNLILYEYGHPIHAFDLRHVRDAKIVVRLATDGEKMATLDGEERTLTADDLVICDGGGPVAVAGVMGGLNSEIRDDTTDVLIECAYFDPRSIRRTSRRLGLHTDSSHRFERGVDPNQVPNVLARAASLIADVGGGAAGEQTIDKVEKNLTPATITLRHARTDALLGHTVAPDVSQAILQRLGCVVQDASPTSLNVQAPTWRPDLGREVDLIEEVARVRGYGAIPTEVPRVRSSNRAPNDVDFVDRLRFAGANAGLYEAITYSFVSDQALALHRVPTQAVRLANPMSEERAVMRTSLLPGLLEAAVHALRRGVPQVRLFEIGRVFTPTDDVLPKEQRTLGVILAGERDAWIGADGAFDFYDAKGAVMAVLGGVLRLEPGFAFSEDVAAGHRYLHPKRCAAVSFGSGGTEIGVLGELHPELMDHMNLANRAIYAELSVDALYEVAESADVVQASGLPKFPSVSRDIAMWVRDEFTAEEIAQALLESAAGLAESVDLFDLYRDEDARAGQRSLAFHVVYRDPNETLTDKRVDKVHAKLGKIARDRFDGTLR